ncbi:hypothetical protein GAU_1271 [Gemmatimonas aurantiaca T-27]|uniref:Uncharacterized protein n=1 Tax=Gemmatimonas aurantiaca (strain DSM 14586 / JCM 11422 / NBRC 100505 / T-27) TaxID=379066 RepID=C1A7V3_GEMAT|nr:hypothetical protein [Gemmatimonas aurantiaca]BAH38313.1 hypothetical protein GAU_1271 [Gemmatimonas aurantiaca T-27]
MREKPSPKQIAAMLEIMAEIGHRQSVGTKRSIDTRHGELGIRLGVVQNRHKHKPAVLLKFPNVPCVQ